VPFEALGHLVQRTRLQDVRETRVLVLGPVQPRVLSQVAEPTAHPDAAGERRVLTGDRREQARLAGAVATHHADLVARPKRQRQAFEDRTPGDLDGQVADLEHAHPGMLA
jgi:hypothetical protein